jgi:hypothetical protein
MKERWAAKINREDGRLGEVVPRIDDMESSHVN